MIMPSDSSGIEYQMPSGQGVQYGGGYGGYNTYGGGQGGNGYIPPAVDKALGDSLGTISACGASNVTLIIALVIACLLVFYLLRRNSAVVDMAMNLIPTATASVTNAVSKFEEKVDVLVKIFKKDP